MTDTQNDNTELDAQVDEIIEELGFWHQGNFEYGKPSMTPQRAKQALTTLIAQREQAADRKTLETVATLLNGDSNQLEVVKNYVWNKLKMYTQKEAE